MHIKYEGNSCTFEEFVDRITSWNDIDHLVVLNTYYKAPYLKDENGEAVLRHLVEISDEIGLSTDKDFNEFYMDSMMFGEE